MKKTSQKGTSRGHASEPSERVYAVPESLVFTPSTTEPTAIVERRLLLRNPSRQEAEVTLTFPKRPFTVKGPHKTAIAGNGTAAYIVELNFGELDDPMLHDAIFVSSSAGTLRVPVRTARAPADTPVVHAHRDASPCVVRSPSPVKDRTHVLSAINMAGTLDHTHRESPTYMNTIERKFRTTLNGDDERVSGKASGSRPTSVVPEAKTPQHFRANPFNPKMFAHIDMEAYHDKVSSPELKTEQQMREEQWNSGVYQGTPRSRFGLAHHKKRDSPSPGRLRTAGTVGTARSSSALGPSSQSGDYSEENLGHFLPSISSASASTRDSFRRADSARTMRPPPPLTVERSRSAAAAASPASRSSAVAPSLLASKPPLMPAASPSSLAGKTREEERAPDRLTPDRKHEHLTHLHNSGYFGAAVKTAYAAGRSATPLTLRNSQGATTFTSICLANAPPDKPIFFVKGRYYNARGEDVSSVVQNGFIVGW